MNMISKNQASPVSSAVRIRRLSAELAVLFTVALAAPFVQLQLGQSKEISWFFPAAGGIWLIGLGIIRLGTRKLIMNASALEWSEERFRNTFEQAAVGICHVALTGKFIWVNQHLCTVVGYPSDELLTLTFQEITHPDDLDTDLESYRQLLNKSADTSICEKRYVRKDGSIVWANLTRSLMLKPTGAPDYIIAVIEDITERKRAEEALRESEEHVRQIFDQTNDAIVLFRMDTFKILDANPAALKLFEVARGELDQMKPWAFITPQVFRDFIRAIPVGDTSLDFQLDKASCFKKDGTKIIVSILGKILKLKDDYVIFCSIRDITEKVRLEGEIRSTQAKLIHTNKMTSLGMLVSGIAHEINNPNHYISVNASMLADVWRDAAPILKRYFDENGNFPIGGLPFTEMQDLAPRMFNGIAEGSRRINAIVTDMRDFVKEDKSGLQGMVDINRLIRNAESILWHHIHKHTDNFHAELQADLPAARGNGQQLEQVIINLIINALQALPGKEAAVFVTTSAEPDQGSIIITVRDTGKGMRKNVLERLREPFFTTNLDKGGTGLGLYISDSIIKEHNGLLEFKSTLGKGTTATIRLPAA